MAFDYLARSAIHDFRSFARLCGGAYSPLRFDKVGRSYQAPALYANLEGGNGPMLPDILLRHKSN